jgi:hypothetical protein
MFAGSAAVASEWRFFVKDNGIGIEPPCFYLIFRIFQQIDSGPDRPGIGIRPSDTTRLWNIGEDGRVKSNIGWLRALGWESGANGKREQP